VGNPSKPATIKLNALSSGCWTFMRRLILIALLTASFQATSTNAQVPFTWDSTGHVVVPALVNGKGPYDFILDTGADESAVYAWFAKSLELPKGESRELSGATGSEQMTVTRLSTLGVGGHVVGNIDADTAPDRSDGAKIAGIVGVDLMAHKLAVIDFACKTFALRPVENVGANIVGKNAKLIKAGSIRGGNQLTLLVTVNGVVGTAVLDTGSRSTQINSTFAAAVGISPNSDAFKDVATRGATKTSISARVGPIGTVHFAGITRPNAVARVVDLPYLKEAGLEGVPAMNLGLDLLRGTRLTVDYSARQFWLATSSCSSEVQ
jgi:predicted aspartyl protease